MDFTTNQLKEKIKEILSLKVARNGLHVNAIATTVINMTKTLFDDTPDKGKVKARINSILYRESEKRKGMVSRVKNPKTNKFRKGVYKLRRIK
jgi:hypothetical protein